MDTEVRVLKQVLVNKQVFDREGICPIEWCLVLRRGLFAQIKNLVFWEGSWLVIEQPAVQANDLWEGPEADSEAIYWFRALFSWQEFPGTHDKVVLRWAGLSFCSFSQAMWM